MKLLIIKSSFEHIIDKDKYNIEDYIKNNEFDTTLYKFYENNFNKKNSKKYLDDHFGIYYYLNYFFHIIINFVYKMFSILSKKIWK